MALRKIDIRNHILNNAKVLGNSNRDLLDVVSDLVNQHGLDKKSRSVIMDGTFLGMATLERIGSLKECDSGRAYRPEYETIRRLMNYFGVEATLNQVHIKKAYQNKAKETS